MCALFVGSAVFRTHAGVIKTKSKSFFASPLLSDSITPSLTSHASFRCLFRLSLVLAASVDNFLSPFISRVLTLLYVCTATKTFWAKYPILVAGFFSPPTSLLFTHKGFQKRDQMGEIASNDFLPKKDWLASSHLKRFFRPVWNSFYPFQSHTHIHH